MSHNYNSISQFFINPDEKIKFSLGYDEAKNKAAPSTFIVTQNYLYIIGKFLFRDTKMLFSETNGLKVIDLNSISAVTEIRKKSPVLLSLFIIFLVVGSILFVVPKSIGSLEPSSNSTTYLFLFLIAFIFLIIYLLLTQRMLYIEFCGGDLLYNLSYQNINVTLDIMKAIFNNKNS